MNNDIMWQKFEKTGSVSAFISYTKEQKPYENASDSAFTNTAGGE